MNTPIGKIKESQSKGKVYLNSSLVIVNEVLHPKVINIKGNRCRLKVRVFGEQLRPEQGKGNKYD